MIGGALLGKLVDLFSTDVSRRHFGVFDVVDGEVSLHGSPESGAESGITIATIAAFTCADSRSRPRFAADG